MSARMDFGDWINYVPAAGSPPVLARSIHGEAIVTIRPGSRLQIANTYLVDESATRDTRQTMFSANVFRSKWNWQLSRELSVRGICQYNSLVTNPLLTSQTNARRFNADLLLTYMVHPGTAVYIGYNSDHQQLAADARFTNDGRQAFVKMSYLFRP